MIAENNITDNPLDVKAGLQSSEIRYRRLFETARDGIFILDAVTREITDANPSAAEMFGCSRDELSGKELCEIGLFKEADESRQAFGELMATGHLSRESLSVTTKSGEVREIELYGNIYTEGARRVIQFNLRDLTERRRAGEARAQQAQKIALLAEIAGKAARLGGWTIELPERTLIWSDENCAIHEVPPGYQPTLEEGLGYFPPEYRDQVIDYIEACAQHGISYDFELPKYTAKGRLIWVRSIGEAVRDEEGRIIRLQGAFQDITLRKQAEVEKEKLIKELQAALAEVKTLQEFLPICSYCKKVRDDENYWSQIENYISEHTHTKFSHSICPDCYRMEVTPQLEKMKQKRLSDL